jgi:hypothetical protein
VKVHLDEDLSDQEYTAAQERALVTRNAHDFKVLAADRVQSERAHAGIIVRPIIAYREAANCRLHGLNSDVGVPNHAG